MTNATTPAPLRRARILVVDDELSMREVLEIFFMQMGHEVTTAADGQQAIDQLKVEKFDLVLTDMRMPRAQGMDVLQFSKAHHPDTPVIVMTAFASTDTAVHAMKLGAHDYFTKPFKLDHARVVVEKALANRALVLENQTLKAQLREQSHHGLLGRSPPMMAVFDLISRVARTRTNILLFGESGTGKELVARAIHDASARASQPFLVINCAAIPESLLESELFGHRKGTFTGATRDHAGLFRSADGGTLLLDEIGEMPLAMQVKLLRVLQERKVKGVGETQEVAVDVRVIAATNRDLAAEVRSGRFREDLYYRLNVICLELPPLRERGGDITVLAYYFLNKFAEEFGKQITEIDGAVVERLLQHPFPGNVRELQNIMERAVALEDQGQVTLSSLPPALRSAMPRVQSSPTPTDSLPEDGLDLDAELEQLERHLFTLALRRTKGRKKAAAELLHLSFRTFRYRLDKLQQVRAIIWE